MTKRMWTNYRKLYYKSKTVIKNWKVTKMSLILYKKCLIMKISKLVLRLFKNLEKN